MSKKASKSTGPRLLLVVPCFNEGATIGALLDHVREHHPSYDTVVIDDGSSDDTEAVAAARGSVVHLACNIGIGGAVQTGIKYALERGYEHCVQIDGDGQHPPDQIALLLRERERSGASIVIGSRFLETTNDGFRSTWTRRMGISLLRAAFRVVHGSKVTDPTSGLRLLDRAAMEFFAQDYPRDFPEPISLAVALRAGLTYSEVPVVMRSRAQGRSSITGLRAAIYMLRVVAYLLLTRFKKP